MVTRQQLSAAAKLFGNALLDIAAELEDERTLPEPDLLSPVAQVPDPQVPTMYMVGLGANGGDRGYPECPICWARGGGGHGGFCPNIGVKIPYWVSDPPAGYLRPPYPEDRVKW